MKMNKKQSQLMKDYKALLKAYRLQAKKGKRVAKLLIAAQKENRHVQVK